LDFGQLSTTARQVNAQNRMTSQAEAALLAHRHCGQTLSSIAVMKLKRVCVYCGSNPGFEPDYAATARDLGKTLAERGLELVYGGSDRGLMGQLAEAALQARGTAIGVIPKALAAIVSQPKLTQLHITDSMHERKALMFKLSDAFIALPGGFGTLEELFELLTWGQLGMHEKPCGLINLNGFFDPLLAFLDSAVQQGFLRPEHRRLLLVADSPARLLEAFASCPPPQHVLKWVDPIPPAL
jgi:uncharacterized protein (TIGR00730 family)